MKTDPVRYVGDSNYTGSRIFRFINLLAAETGKGPDDFLFVEPYSIGDVVHTLGYLKRFREVYCRPDQRIILLCQRRAAAVAQVMPYVDAVSGADLAAFELHFEYIASLYDGLTPHIPIICPDDMHAKGKLARAGHGFANKRSIFFLRPEDPWCPPVVSDELRAAAAERMAAAGAAAGRSVLLLPGAMSIRDLPDAFWAALVARLRQDRPDLDIFTEMTGREAPLPDTQPVVVSLPELIPAVEFAGGCVALRSGLCDLLAYAEAAVLALTPEEHGYYKHWTRPQASDLFVRNWARDTTLLDEALPVASAGEGERVAGVLLAERARRGLA